MADDPIPSASETVRAAIRQKHTELLSRRDRMLQTREEIDRGLRRIEGELVHLIETAKMFGDNLEPPKTSPAPSSNLVRYFYTTAHHGPGGAKVITPVPATNLTTTAATSVGPLAPPPKIKQIVLDRLRAAGEKGARAAEIRQFIVMTYGIETHEKTVGMQLYRFLKAGQARREGATWFFVPPTAEKKNPGVGAPGSNDVFE